MKHTTAKPLLASSARTDEDDEYFKIAQSIQKRYQSDSAIVVSDRDQDSMDERQTWLGAGEEPSASRAFTKPRVGKASDTAEAEDQEGTTIATSRAVKSTLTKDIGEGVQESEPESEVNPELDTPVEELGENLNVAMVEESKKAKKRSKKSKKKKKKELTTATKSQQQSVTSTSTDEDESSENLFLYGVVGVAVIAILAAVAVILLELAGVVSYGLSESLGLIEPKQSSLRKVLANLIRI